MSKLQDELRRKGQLPLGDKLMMYGGEWRLLRPGDTYLAHTEGEEPDILTVRRVEPQKRRTGVTIGKVFPKERKKKLYDLHEVVKISFIDNPNLDTENKPDVERTESADRVDERTIDEPIVEPRPTAVPGAPGTPRPIPRPPSRAGGTDYAAASKRADQADTGADLRDPDGS